MTLRFRLPPWGQAPPNSIRRCPQCGAVEGTPHLASCTLKDDLVYGADVEDVLTKHGYTIHRP